MKKIIIFPFLVFSMTIFVISCGGSVDKNNSGSIDSVATAAISDTTQNGNPSYDPNRGDGKFHDVQISDKLEIALADKGEKIYELKCSACHKLTDERLVGPGWKGVTKRQTATWIMNFVTNTDEMITKDPKAQAMLEICMVRMPNQGLSDDDARNILEFMRKNDGVK